jgi:uncharacterized repeat protein (TIGR01451 family)
VTRLQTRSFITLPSQWPQRLAATLLVTGWFSPAAAIAEGASPTNRPVLSNQAAYTYTNPATSEQFVGISSQLNATAQALIDPKGRILACGGGLLPDYTGFSVGVYEPNLADPTGTELGNLVSLTPTELPDVPNNGIPGGMMPNPQNKNPFLLSNSAQGADRGVYSFLFDPNKGQVSQGKTYILVVNPPANSIYSQRRIKIQILESTGGVNNTIVRYLATSLDGQPITASGDTSIQDTVAYVANAETIGLDLLAFQFTSALCQPDQAQIVKTGDRAAAEPGDSVIYRLSVKNRSDVSLNQIALTDTLPIGFKFIDKSVQGELLGKAVPVTTESSGPTVIFRPQVAIPPGEVLNIAYGALLTPDAVRGTGRNSAIVNARRSDNQFNIKDGPATHQLRIQPGILSDCGIIIGRVFEDRNFDGEQQPGEPGIPNAVIFLDDGNRITTDVNGLFSLSNVLPGYRTGVLDFNSIPGYTLAPNHRFQERNSQSRLVHIAPGSLVRMNFAVTPAVTPAANQSAPQPVNPSAPPVGTP